METKHVKDGGDEGVETHATPDEVLSLLRIGHRYSDLEGSLEVDGDIKIENLVFDGDLDLFQFASIHGNLFFKNVTVNGDINLEMTDIDKALLFDNLTVVGDVICSGLRAGHIVFKKLEVSGVFSIMAEDDINDSHEIVRRQRI